MPITIAILAFGHDVFWQHLNLSNFPSPSARHCRRIKITVFDHLYGCQKLWTEQMRAAAIMRQSRQRVHRVEIPLHRAVIRLKRPKGGNDLRRNPEFTPRAIEGWRPRVEAITETLLDRVAKAGRMDLVAELALPVPATLICEMLGVPGMTVPQTIPFRDKEIMKQVLDKAGIRTPRHASATTANAVREAAERIGYPLVVKPIDGAGSADTYRVESAEDLERVLPALRGVPEVSMEEFVEGEDFTFETLTVNSS